MANTNDPPGDGGVEITPTDPNGETSIAAWAATIADLEQQRIAIQREEQAIILRGLEFADSVDRRQNETTVKGIEAETERDRRRYRLAIYALILLAGVPLALLTLVIVMALFGGERQSQIALDVLRVVGIALGGGGFIFGVAYATNRLIRG